MRHYLIFLFIVLVSMVGTKAYAYDIKEKNADGVEIYYNYINDATELEVTQVDYRSYSGVVKIPKEVTYMSRTRNVTKIGKNAFNGCHELTSISIPNSVTGIGEKAFLFCYGLTSVNIPNSVVTIEDDAFASCEHLTTVTISSSVNKIGNRVFAHCHNLSSVTIPNSVTFIGGNTFRDCWSLTSINIPTGITSLEYALFYGCRGLTSIVIPNNITNISSDVFRDCKGLISVTIPNSVTYIGSYVFLGCDIPTVISKIENPYDITTAVFSDNTFYNATLYVPMGTIGKYKEKRGWNKFVFIEEGLPSSIIPNEDIKAKEIRRHRIDGTVINSPQNGINIIKMNNGTTKKVFVK